VKRYIPPACALALCLGLVMPITACNGADSEPDCAELGILKDGDTPPSTGTTLIVIIDMPDNQPATIERIAADVQEAIERKLDGATEIRLYGGIYAGIDTTGISCMDGRHRSFTYVPQENNETVVERERDKYLDGVNDQIRLALVSASGTEQPTGDFRTALAWGKSHLRKGASADVKVVLWSNMLLNGSDCLDIQSSVSASKALAEEIASRCESEELIPSMDPVDVEIIGAGYAVSPSLASFGTQLASAFCPRISNRCHFS